MVRDFRKVNIKQNTGLAIPFLSAQSYDDIKARTKGVEDKNKMSPMLVND